MAELTLLDDTTYLFPYHYHYHYQAVQPESFKQPKYPDHEKIPRQPTLHLWLRGRKALHGRQLKRGKFGWSGSFEEENILHAAICK